MHRWDIDFAVPFNRRLVPKDIPELLTTAASFVVYKLPISP